MKIGVFDSGFGGLTTLKQIVKALPQYDYIYLGDNARAPYGDRSERVITEFTRQGVEYLFKKDCALVILACNTASARALRHLQQEWLTQCYPDRRILGIVIPIAEEIALVKGVQKIGVIGTRATISSNVYAKELEKLGRKDLIILQESCPLLVPLIEEGWEKTIPATMIVKTYLRPLKIKQIHTLVLGCTHYPIIIKKIQRIMGKNVRVLEPGSIVAKSLKDYLKRHPDIEILLEKKGTIELS
ncbi:MAG: glutamate racemase, partial [bacterium]|nr:glutamate racemase [bacterium]